MPVLLSVQDMLTISKSFYLNPFFISTVLTSRICLPGACPFRILVTSSAFITARVYIGVIFSDLYELMNKVTL